MAIGRNRAVSYYILVSDLITYMKNEAVTTRPIASVKTDRVGYHATGIGLAMGLASGAFE